MKGNVARDTKPELLLRRELRKIGCGGYRLHWRKAPGRPDIAYPGRRVAVFVNGCFWHRCPHCKPKLPKAHREFWRRKFALNKERDARKVRELREAGWAVITVWECEIKENVQVVAARIAALLRNTGLAD